MGRKVLLAVVCWLTLSKATAEQDKRVDSSVIPDNESAESAPRLYKSLPVGVYASAAPYASYSHPVPAGSHPVPVRAASVIVPNTRFFHDVKDSYGKHVAAPQAFKAAFPQQFIPLQDLPPHLAQPLVSASPSFHFKTAPNYFFGPQSYKVQALQLGPTPTPLTHFGSISQPLVYAEDLKHFAPSSNLHASVTKVSIAPQTTSNKAHYVNAPTHQRLQETPQAHSHAPKDAKQQASHHHEKGQIQAAPAQTHVTTLVNGKKTVITLETKPPLPLLDLNLLEPLTFDNPLVPQVQHFLPKISSATYHKLPSFNKVKDSKKKQKEIIVTKTKSYDSGYISEPAPPKKKKTKSKPASKPGITVKGHPDNGDFSYEINTPNHKETYNEQVVKYNKETNMKPVEYSYNMKTHNEPEVYSYMHSSKAPLKVTHVEYNSEDDKPKHLVYTTSGEQEEEDLEDERRPSSQESEDSGESSAESEEEGPAPRPLPQKAPKNHEYSHSYSQSYELPRQQHSHHQTQNYETPKKHHSENHLPKKHHHSEHDESPKQHHQSHHQSENYEKPRQHHSGHHSEHNAPKQHHSSNHHSEHHDSPKQHQSHHQSENYEKPRQHHSGHYSEHNSPKQHHSSNHHSEHHDSPKQHHTQHHSENDTPQHNNEHHDSPGHSDQHSEAPPKQYHHHSEHHSESPNHSSSPQRHSNHPGPSEAPKEPQQHYVYYEQPKQFYTPVMTFQVQNNGPAVPAPFHPGFQVHQAPRQSHHLQPEHRGQYQQQPNQRQVIQSTPQYHQTLTLDAFQPITPEYNQDVRLLPTHAPHAAPLKVDPNQHVQIGPSQHTFNANPVPAKQKISPRNEKHQAVSPTPIIREDPESEPHIEEKSKHIIIEQEGEAPEERHMHIEQAIGEMIKSEENNEEDFEKAYKESAFGFPAYNEKSAEAIEEEIYDPESYGAPHFKSEYKVEDTPFKQYEQEGDEFPKSARLAYKDSRDNTMEDYFLEFAVHKPESYTDQVKNKVDYYKAFKNNRPSKSFYVGDDERKEKKSEKFTAAPSFGDHYFGTSSKPKAKQSSAFAQYKASPIKYEFDYSKDAPKDSVSYASRPYHKYKRTHFVEPQFQYGFEPISAPIILESELDASASNDNPESEKPGTRKKIYKENWYIKKTRTSGSKPS